MAISGMDDDYLRVLTLKEMPSATHPLLLNGLLDIPANFHVVTEWHPVDNAQHAKRSTSAAVITTTPKPASSRISRIASRMQGRVMSW